MNKAQKDKLWGILKSYAPASISWNHYDLANFTDVKDTELWKEFLQVREVEDWLNEERVMLRKSELAKLSTDVAASRSVGQAQLLNAMSKLTEDDMKNKQQGPAFIYCYVPLNEQQKNAPNVRIMEHDIFYDETKAVSNKVTTNTTEEEPDFN